MATNTGYFSVKSTSSDNIYVITLKKENGKLFLKCDCEAGHYKTYCKHITAFLTGNHSFLLNTDEIEKFKKLHEEGTLNCINAALKPIADEMSRIDYAIKELQEKKNQHKKELARVISSGIIMEG